ncbi:CBS domain-containing protein [Trinickia mobilis]|uniref:CBS domain-containing protein n=1 Tax=Trinickia mobilis TaxID=2816356 RepID=UPI001A8CF407|nr:CBS domain-containing protein [Trinickia mobilis]
MRVSDVFRSTNKIIQVDGRAALRVAIRLMREHNVGALLVRSDGTCSTRLLSERDVIDALAARGSAVLEEYVDNVVPAGCISCRPDDPIHHVMREMTQHRVRHLPVQDGSDVVGILSIGDIIKAQLDTMSLENRILREEVILKQAGKC